MGPYRVTPKPGLNCYLVARLFKGDLEYAGVVVPLQPLVSCETVAFLSTNMVFGTPLDITLSELAIERFYPADKRSSAL